jgi:hypothetical protein
VKVMHEGFMLPETLFVCAMLDKTSYTKEDRLQAIRDLHDHPTAGHLVSPIVPPLFQRDTLSKQSLREGSTGN